jgi:hypothetical protein
VEHAELGVAEHGVEGVAHADPVDLGARPDEKRLLGRKLVASEQTTQASPRREGGVEILRHDPLRPVQREAVEGAVTGRTKGITPRVSSECREGLAHATMV